MNTLNPLLLNRLKNNWHWYLGLGITLTILGTLAILFSYFTTLFSIIYVGIFLLTLGIFEAIKSFKVHPFKQFLLHVFLGIICIFTGLSLIFYPEVSALNITLFLALLFIISGTFSIIFALTSNVAHPTWVLINGILNVLLGAIIWYQWPLSGFWVIGMFVGINMVFTGWGWIMLALELKNIKTDQR